MKDRIRQIMESQNMTQQVFAEFIGQSPATLSSIFNGRTRPTINIVEAIKRKIPNISTDWLMFGSGEMMVDDSFAPSPTPAEDQSQKFDRNPMLDFDNSNFSAPQNPLPAASNFNSVKNTRSEIVREELKFADKPQRRVIEIRVFYDDQTWDTFVPVKK